MPVIELRGGRRLRLSALHARQTYGGLLEGAPTTALNDRLLSQAGEDSVKMWGRRPTFVVPPAIRSEARPARPGGFWPIGRRESIIPWLPDWTCLAWLDSAPMDARRDGSHLVVVWCQPDLDEPPQVSMARYLADLDWERHARDWDA